MNMYNYRRALITQLYMHISIVYLIGNTDSGSSAASDLMITFTWLQVFKAGYFNPGFSVMIYTPSILERRYLIFKVTIANTTHKMVTIQNRTAILLS